MSDILLPSPVSYGQIQDNAQVAQVINATRDPSANDKYAVGVTYWANVTSGSAWQLVSYSAGVPQWVALGGGASAVATINGLSPTAGNIVIAGTSNQLTATSAGSTVTLSTPSVFTAPGSVTATTTVTATLGAITATNGNVVLGTAGNGIVVKAGTNARIGAATLTAGSSGSIANTSVTANTKIFTSVSALGTVTAPQAMLITKSAGVGFTITSADATDTSTVDWFMVESN